MSRCLRRSLWWMSVFVIAFSLFIVEQTVWASKLAELDDVDPTTWTAITNLIRQNATSLTYDELLRYSDKPIVIEGKIVQCIHSDESRVREYRINVTPTPYGDWEDTIYLGLPETASRIPLLEGDMIDVAGYTKGTITYTAILGHHITVPLIVGFDVRLLAKRGDPWPPVEISEAEALQIVQGSDIYQQAIAAYAEQWAEDFGISYSISSTTEPDSIDRWWIVATNANADPNVRSQSHILLLCVDKVTQEIYVYLASDGLEETAMVRADDVPRSIVPELFDMLRGEEKEEIMP